MRGVARLRAHPGTARVRWFLLCIALLAASPVFAFESHVVNVRMSLTAPVNVDRGEFELGADGVESADFTVALTPSFLEQSRLDAVGYRIVASLEPSDEFAARSATPTVVCVRDPVESDGMSDEAERGLLGTNPKDASDRWTVALRPPEGALSGSVEATASVTETASVARWSVHVRVEVIGYGGATESGQ